MRIKLRKVGNSRGVIIPASLLSACEMVDEVDIRQEGGHLVLSSVKAPRAHWFDSYRAEEDVEPISELAPDDGIDEWEW